MLLKCRSVCGWYCAALFLLLVAMPASSFAAVPDLDVQSPMIETPTAPPAAECPTTGNDDRGQFTVVIDEAISSKNARNGDPIYARLGSHLLVNGHDFLPGSRIVGHITEVDKARRHILAEVSPHRWLHSDGGIGIEFDQVIDENGEQAAIDGCPIAMPKQFRAAVGEKSIAVSKKGVVQPSIKTEIAPKLTRMAIGAAGTLLHSPAVPLVGGLVGAIAPSLVLESSDKEYQSEIKHRRLKGFATGAIAGLPGGFLVNDTLMKGRDAVIKSGTVLLLINKTSNLQSD